MGGVSAEKLVKSCIKQISKDQELDYDEVKDDCKKILKMAKKFDEQLLETMEALMELSNVGSLEELDEFDSDILRMYCQIKELDDSVSEKKLRVMVWEHMQEEFELSDSETDSDSDSEDEGSEDSETEPEPEVEVKEPKEPKKSKKSEKTVTIIE
jgi:hypothetical protein